MSVDYCKFFFSAERTHIYCTCARTYNIIVSTVYIVCIRMYVWPLPNKEKSGRRCRRTRQWRKTVYGRLAKCAMQSSPAAVLNGPVPQGSVVATTSTLRLSTARCPHACFRWRRRTRSTRCRNTTRARFYILFLFLHLLRLLFICLFFFIILYIMCTYRTYVYVYT